MKPIDVLVVEDDESIRELYFDALSGAKLNVKKAAGGVDGVQQALEYRPKVILMDIMMPDLDGHRAVQQIRADDWGKTAKIIFLTNRSDAEDVVYAVEEGSEDYIIKAHTDIKEIINRVRLAMNT